MGVQQKKLLRLVPAPPGSASFPALGVAELNRAVKGAGFYPQGHPFRTDSLRRLFALFSQVLAERELVLTVTRKGVTLDGESVEPNAMVLQLIHDCFVRRISSVTFMQDLLLADLETFVRLLNCDPQETASAGGFARQLEALGVCTIWINEKDLSAIWEKRARASFGEWAEEVVDPPPLPEPQGVAAREEPSRRGVPELLELMAGERGEERYRGLGRELLERLSPLPRGESVLPVLEELLRQHREPQRTLPQREYALLLLKQLADGAAEQLLDSLVSRLSPDKGAIHRVLAAVGGKGAYWIIQRLCLAPGLYERKALATALVALGPQAVAPTLAMLKDERWYVVRNMVAILGELGSPECVAPLTRALYHEDLRVRKETVRALTRLGGEAARSALLPLLEESDPGVLRHAVLSLGLMRSSEAVPALLRLLERRDLLLKGLEVKKELVTALGRIGDRRGTGALLKLLVARGWPAWGRWLELKLCAAAALGALGDEAALPALSGLAAGKGPLAEACREALDAIERVSGGNRD